MIFHMMISSGTTEDRHKEVVAKIFKRLLDQGDIYLDQYEGAYIVHLANLSSRNVRWKKAMETVLIAAEPVEKVKEESYFFKMSKYADRLLKFYEENPDFIQPESAQKRNDQ